MPAGCQLPSWEVPGQPSEKDGCGDSLALKSPLTQTPPTSGCFSPSSCEGAHDLVNRQTNMFYPCNGILPSHKKEWHTDSCYKVDDSPKTVCWVQRARHKRLHIVWIHWYEMSRVGNFISGLNRQKSRRIFRNHAVYMVSFQDDGNILELDRGSGCKKKMVNFMLCGFYLHLLKSIEK